jgi:hypothetical protein
MAEETKNENKKKNVKKYVLIGLGAATVVTGGILAYKKWLAPKLQMEPDESDQTNVTETATTTASNSGGSSTKSNYSSSGSSWGSSSSGSSVSLDFPLKKGSRGEKVRAVQEALIYRYGKTILPKYGADGDFGSELEAALVKSGYEKQIDESLYNIILKSGSPNAKTTALRLQKAVDSKSYQGILDTVKTIRNLSDYKAVNEEYKNLTAWFIEPVPVVIAAIAPFLNTEQRDKMRLEFKRIGLKFDGSKWSLSGLNGYGEPLLITIRETVLYDPKNKVKVKIPQNVVIGYKIKEKKGYTLLRMLEKNRKLIVKSSTVKIHEKH